MKEIKGPLRLCFFSLAPFKYDFSQIRKGDYTIPIPPRTSFVGWGRRIWDGDEITHTGGKNWGLELVNLVQVWKCHLQDTIGDIFPQTGSSGSSTEFQDGKPLQTESKQ